MLSKQNIQEKLLKLEAAKATVTAWKASGLKVVFTNGCFDIMHAGHIDYLSKAAALGDKLVIGLNSDASVSKLKGKHRPICDEKSRGLVLAAMGFVDVVTVFGEETPKELIEKLSPDFLVKGGDYSPETVVGAEHVKSLGGEVVILPFVDGYSTSAIEEKIRSFS